MTSFQATEDAKSATATAGGGKKSKMGSGAPAETLPHVQVGILVGQI